jgi:uncharacterized membrane protein
MNKDGNLRILNKLLFLWIVILLGIFTFLIPPFQKPDEITHFYRATAFVKGELFCNSNNIDNGYFVIPRNFFELPNDMLANSIKYHYENKFPRGVLTGKQNTDNTDTKISGLCILPFTGYLANAIGIEIGLLFNNPLLALYLGRLSAGILFLICFFIAIKNIPKQYKPILYLFAIIPMVLHQVTAVSYDAIQLSLIVLIFSYLLKYLSVNEINKKQLILFTALLTLLTLVKTGYYPVLLLYFLIPYKKITGKFINYLAVTCAILLPSVLINFIFAKLVVASFVTFNLVNQQLQIKFMLANPSLFFSAFFNSIAAFGEFYYKSFIGIFGWLDYSMSFLIYIIYAGLLLFIIESLINKIDKPILSKKQLFFLVFILIIVSSLIFMAQYIGWTPVAASLIQGVQGRYFLVLFPFSIFAIVQFALIIGKRNFYILVACIFSMFLIFNIVFSIYNRYYNYAYLYSNQGSLEKNVGQLKSSHINKVAIPIKQSYRFVIKNLDLNRKIGGFEFIFNSDKKLMTTPYEYYVKDEQCSKIYKHGFLDIEKLQNSLSPNIYDEKFGNIIKPVGSKVCVELIPFEKPASGEYINLYSLNKKILFNFLLISN